MQVVALLLGDSFITDFWTTYRLPFQRYVTITYPPSVEHPQQHIGVVAHEMIHVRQFARFGAPLVIILLAGVLPLPLLFSGRWFIERSAYLEDIRARRMTIEHAVDVLWRRYGFAWPKALMRRWFRARLG